MEAYPHDYLAPCVPLYVLAGVDAPSDLVRDDHDLQRNGSRIGPDNPTVSDDRSNLLLKAFLDLDILQDSPGPMPEKSRAPPLTFRVAKAKYSLPARKARPQASHADGGPESMPSFSAPSQTALHSPLSPLSAGSPLFADGIMTPLWNLKYQAMVPSVFIVFYNITKDPGSDSLNDNRLKNEIAGVKQTLMDSRYRTRLVVILLASDMLGTVAVVEERLMNIRNGGRLDDKSLYYLPAAVEAHELRSFAADVCSSLRSVSTEFYRDLTKHSRRKRDRGSNPLPPLQAGKIYANGITRSGWVARFEYKLGIFAEYRGEPDVAERHYLAAMNALFDPQGPFENLSSWSPRFNETRMFADVTFIRLIRCQLGSSSPTSAVRSWLRHRDTSRELVERKGKGLNNYGWLAWESRWPRVMAELVSDSRLTFPKIAPFTAVESSIAQELHQLQVNVSPWENLHHAGYWYRLSAIYAGRRQELAAHIPEEDRVPPGQSPASAVARRNDTYDFFMVSEPHIEWQTSQEPDGTHVQDIVACLGHAISDFSQRSQVRQTDDVRVNFCQRLLEMGKTHDATATLKSVWAKNQWRSERWLELLQVLDHSLYETAALSRDYAEQICALWELHSLVFTPIEHFNYDLHEVMRNAKVQNEESAIDVDLDDRSVLSFLTNIHVVNATINFGTHEARAGEPLDLQLTICSKAHSSSKPIRVDNLAIHFDGNLSDFELTNNDDDKGTSDAPISLSRIDFGGQRTSLGNALSAKADMKLASGQTRVFDFSLVPSDAGTITAKSALLTIREGRAIVKYKQQLSAAKQRHTWWISDKPGNVRPSFTKNRISAPVIAVKVLPRPPKMDISILKLTRVCYTDERNVAELHITNKEDEEAEVNIEITATSDSEKATMLSWQKDDKESQESRIELSLGKLAAGANITKSFELHSDVGQTDLVVEARVKYTLSSKPDVQISKTTTEEIVIIQPFEATHHVRQEYHSAPWPSYFYMDDEPDHSDEDDTTSKARGLIYRYLSETQLVSFATESLTVEKVRLSLDNPSSQASISSQPIDDAAKGFEIASNGNKTLKALVDIQKRDLDERKAVSADPFLHVVWRRAGTDPSANVSTKLPLPPLALGGSEPRVLARPISSPDSRMLCVDYVLENPSAHFLTFNYSMEPSEDFAFSGPKLASVQLTPLSRTSVRYVLLPHEAGRAIRPTFNVIDAYFNKTLSVMPTGGLKHDGEGLIVGGRS